MSKNKIALGTVQFGLDYGVANQSGQIGHPEVVQILSVAKENGVNLLDTAIAYGVSERVLGGAGIESFRVVTKLPPVPLGLDDISCWVDEQIDLSMKRLGKKKLYGLLLHRPQDLLGKDSKGLINALINLKERGLVQKIGISIYSPDELDQIFKKIQIDLVQAPLNVIDRRMETGGWLGRLKNSGVEIHARSVFLQGLLLLERSKIPEKFNLWARLWDEWHEKLDYAHISPLEACLAYPLSLEQVDRVVVGVDSTEHLEEILSAAGELDNVLDTSFMVSNDTRLIHPSSWNRL